MVKDRGEVVEIEHVGSAHTDAELALLLAGARRPTGGLFLRLSDPPPPPSPPPSDPLEHLGRFLSLATPTAQRLASLFAAAPLTLPVMRLVQHVMAPDSSSSHLAEVFLSGLLYREPGESSDRPEDGRYEFLPGVREALLDRGDRYDAVRVLVEVSRYVSSHLGQPLDFPALLADPSIEVPALAGGALSFARVSVTVLRQLGSRFADVAARLEQSTGTAAPPGA